MYERFKRDFALSEGHAWHYDESHFSTTLMLQTAQAGGKFQHTPIIRRGEQVYVDRLNCYYYLESLKPFFYQPSEDDHDRLRDIFEQDDNHTLVSNLVFEPGTLSIFSGKRCLHRVTKVYRKQMPWDKGEPTLTWCNQASFKHRLSHIVLGCAAKLLKTSLKLA